MAFYGVDVDTMHHKRDTIFHVDSAHISIQASLAVAYNSGMAGLITQLNNSSQGPVGQYGGTYISRHAQPGVAYTFGFDYITREYWNRMFFTVGIEMFNFNCTGYIHQLQYNVSDTVSYTISVLALNVPLHAYCRLIKSHKLRLSVGAGITPGLFVSQNSVTAYSGPFYLTNPVNLGSFSVRIDVAISRHTWFAFEPFFAAQLSDPVTHIETAGLKVILL